MLYLFDIDGTLVRSFMREGGGGASQAYDLVEVLPGRRERLAALWADGHDVVLVTNQGGVAFGFQTIPQVMAKIAAVGEALGIAVTWIMSGPGEAWTVDGHRVVAASLTDRPMAFVSLRHPHAKVERWKGASDWRKPGGGMVREALAVYRCQSEHAVFVGDMDTDRQAAAAAGVRYVDADVFFA